MVKATQEKFPSFNACSFDKGFHSPANQTDLKARIGQVVLPKKASFRKPIRSANTPRNLNRRKSNIPPLSQPLTLQKSMGWINALTTALTLSSVMLAWPCYRVTFKSSAPSSATWSGCGFWKSDKYQLPDTFSIIAASLFTGKVRLQFVIYRHNSE